jgi:methylated-DNA-protein-cysteine methyltransferase related protein
MRKLSTPMANDFFTQVYEVVRMIPCGRVTTYGAIARYLGSPQSSRMVGWALNACHDREPFVPAHRVVNRVGMLSGKVHFHGKNLMQQLLESEGIKIENDCVVEFDKLFWNPYGELI